MLHYYLKRYPPLRDNLISYKFSGRGQRETPVATVDNLWKLVRCFPAHLVKSFYERRVPVYLSATEKLVGDIHEFIFKKKNPVTTKEENPLKLFDDAIEVIKNDPVEEDSIEPVEDSVKLIKEEPVEIVRETNNLITNSQKSIEFACKRLACIEKIYSSMSSHTDEDVKLLNEAKRICIREILNA